MREVSFTWGFPLEYVLASVSYLIPLNKKPGWVRNVCLIVAAQEAAHILLSLALFKMTGMPGYGSGQYLIMGFGLFVSFLLGIVMFRVSARGTLWDAVLVPHADTRRSIWPMFFMMT